jgi:hypothetical protein
METKKEAPELLAKVSEANVLETVDKDTINSLNIKFKEDIKINSAIKSLFISGRKLTAKEINRIVGTNDARKVISTLRREGMNIQDVRLENHCKLYWYMVDQAQQSIQFCEL